VLVGTTNDQVTTADGHAQATCGLAGFEQRLQRGGDRREP
jgi:hypothetical protein